MTRLHQDRYDCSKDGRAHERGSDLDLSLVADQLFSLIALPSYNPRQFGITGGLKR